MIIRIFRKKTLVTFGRESGKLCGSFLQHNLILRMSATCLFLILLISALCNGVIINGKGYSFVSPLPQDFSYTSSQKLLQQGVNLINPKSVEFFDDESKGRMNEQYDNDPLLHITPSSGFNFIIPSNERAYGRDVAVDSVGDVYVVGNTGYGLPVMKAYDHTYNGNSDVFIAKFSANGSLLWSTYFGGQGDDYGRNIVVDTYGNVYIAGDTTSRDLPLLNAYDTSYNGNLDAFVAKFSSNGSLLWSTCFGGESDDTAQSICVDGDGNVYIAGYTGFSNFPVLETYDDTPDSDGYDVFVAKFSSDGSLIWSNQFGGEKDDAAWDIAIDNIGNVYVTGYTSSDDFPILKAYDDSYNGNMDVFIVRLSDNGSTLWGTYFGGEASETAYGIDIDIDGNVYITGYTVSDHFPVLNAYDDSYNGNSDVFIAKFSDNASLLWSTYFGGEGDERAYGISIDIDNNVYITGYTCSSDFPVLNTYDGTYNGGWDAFLAKFSSDGSLLCSTCFGGESDDTAQSICVDGDGNVYVIGYTSSDDFPILSAYDDTHNDGWDVFVAKFNSSGSLLWSTFLGGKGNDWGHDITINNGYLYITGYTCSDDFPLLNPYDDSFSGDFLKGEAFITKFSNTGSLLWSTYLGGNDGDCGWSIASDDDGNVFVVGSTCSDDFPVLKAYDDTLDGWCNAFVVKFSSTERLLWSTYFGGGHDVAKAVTVDHDGNVYVTGYTSSDDFPLLNAYDDTYHGEDDAFIIAFGSRGSLLLSTYLGGRKTDRGLGICINPNGDLYVTGSTFSENFLQLSNNLNEPLVGIASHVFVFSINLTNIVKIGFFGLQRFCFVSLLAVLSILVILKKKHKS